LADLEGLELDNFTCKQTFYLTDMFGEGEFNESFKNSLGQAIIDRIRDRTAANKSVYGVGLKDYSTDYIKSAAFEQYGKSANDINMTLTGSMLESLDIIESTENTITIGFLDDTNEAKAANHNVGNTVPKRPFFGINATETQELIDEFAELVDKPQTVADLLDLEILEATERQSIFDVLSTRSSQAAPRALRDLLDFENLDDTF
jgi:hypothetical protein